MDRQEHTHAHAHGHDHEHHAHDHAHEHNHSHTHDPKEIRSIVNRLSRAGGHLEAVKRMIEEGKDCSDVLIQLAAVRAEINNAGKELLKEHMEHCIVEAIEENDIAAVERLNEAIDKFMK
ncbi:MAG: metal-sensing transcriptional repressor [Butyrivibrio sp.]|nr:metal-sensing transcriptional repressor [Butyrivibrio sp.]